MSLTDAEYLSLYIALLGAFFALCTQYTFQALGFLMVRRAKLQIICFICCCCGAINSGMLLFLTIFPPGYCWWIPIGSVFWLASLISTTILLVFRASAVITLTSLVFHRIFWIFCSVILVAQVALGIAVSVMSRDVPVLSNNACAPIVRRGLLAGFYGSLIVGSVVLTGIFSYQLIKAYKYRRDSVLRVIFISSAVCAILSGLSQITFSLVILFKPIPEKYDLILIKSDMTINVLITVSFVHRVMQESRQSSARSSMQSAMQSPPQKPQLSKSLERQLENAESGTLQLATTSHSSDGIPRY